MGSFFRVILAAVLMVGAIAAHAQPAVWGKVLNDTNFPVAGFDASSNLYVATREATQTANGVYLTKFNALGTQVFRTQVSSFYPDYPIQLTGVKVIGNSVFVSYYRNGAVAAVDGFVAKVNATTGLLLFNADQGGAIPYAMDTNGSDLVTAGMQGSTGFVRFVSQSNGAFLTSWPFTAERVNGVAVTSTGVAFAAGSIAGGGGVIARATSSALDFTKTIDWTTHSSERLTSVKVDEVNGRVYVLGMGYYGSSGTDLDCLLGAYDMATGLNENKQYFGGSDYDYPGDIIVDSLGRLTMSSYESRPSSTYTHVTRYDSALSFVTSTFYAARGGYGRGMALDKSNNVYVADQSDAIDSDLQVVKLNASTLSVSFIMRDDPGAEDMATQVFVDSANIYVCGMMDYPTKSYVARLQFLKFVFADTLVIGGNSLAGKVRTFENVGVNTTFSLVSSNPSVLAVPASVTILAASNEISFTATSVPVSANTNVTITASSSGNICAQVISVLAPTVSNLVVSPNVVVGGNNATGTVNISGKAPVGGKVVSLSSSLPAAATTPASTTISAGSTGRTFIVTTFGVSANKGVVITATTGAVSKTFFMAVNAPSLTTFTVTPSSVKGGTNSTLNVGLNGKAPTGGWKVLTYSGSSSFVVVPSDVTVPVGATSQTATLTTVAVTSSIPITIFGTRSGIYKTVTLTLTP